MRSLYRLRWEHREKCFAYFEKIECAHCGITDRDVLEFDHIDPKTKELSIAVIINSRIAWDIAEKELAKCQLLCANCHKKKTAKDMNAWAFTFAV